MKKEIAQEILEALAQVETTVQKIDSIVSSMEGDEKEKFRRLLGQFAGNHFELVKNIKEQFPEFDPEGDGKDLYRAMKEKYDSKYT